MLEAIASSLTEMFSPTIIAERVSGMLANYKWITSDTLAYFTPRLTQAPQDSAFALAYVRAKADTVERSSRCWRRFVSSARCCGLSSMPCTSPMLPPV
jgi:pyrroloquinoline-quinone synthase